MKKAKSILALILALVMALALVACGGQQGSGSGDSTHHGPFDPNRPTTSEDKTLQVGYSPFNSKFTPFFSQTAYDQDAMAMTQIGLLNTDRTGAPILKGIDGETRNYNGTDYTYYGPADLTITENKDGTVFYDFKLRDDIKFSDGEPVTIDDVIFTMYVLADPTYDGNSTFYAQPIQGMEEYRSGMGTMISYLVDVAGEGKSDPNVVPDDVANAFWEKYHAASKALAEEIVAYVVEAGAAEEGDVVGSAALWGFDIEENTIESFAAALEAKYGSDVAGMIDTENAGSTVEDLFPGLDEYTATVTYGETAPNITGIQRIDDNNLRIVLTEVNATAIYQLGVTIAPMHYYGDKAQYDYANNKFGFPKGDLSGVHAKDTKPLGAGPYKFIKFENGVINFESNESYYLGCPYTKYVNFVETNSDDQKLNGVVTGTIDITDPSFSTDTVGSIKKNNSNGELTGDKITTNTVDNLGYGYIGQNAINVSVGGNPSSDESKALRHAFATVFSVYRDVAIDSYYGDRASVINYPISNTSWAAPRPADDDYQIAFSVDVDGKPLYTSDMTAEQKYAAALEGALGFFEKAGYTVENGKLTAAPAGAKLEYTFWIPADGTGDHPSFMIVDEASRALATIGMKLNIKDLANSTDLWNNLDALQVEMWAAAWGSTVDPDMTQIYFSDCANGPVTGQKKNPNGGPNQGGSNYEYCIADPTLDQNIKDALASTDQAYRKAIYKDCLDIVIDWACEIPTYQRQNAIIFSTQTVNLDTVTPDITTFYGWMAEIQDLRMN
ncbi:MAG: ABC transporter substrate-binding protein [Oscillospiraceae bacterium]|nr:ABC transporter substrate-binding protein [Oscillospiraceae bacterium]